MIAASTFASGDIVRVLTRLNRGEAVPFSHATAGPPAFTITKVGHSSVLRTPAGIALASGPTFAEIWRKRPRIGTTNLTEVVR